MKKFNESLKEENPKYKYRRSKNSQRNWRNREAARKYEKTWDKRFRNCCCVLNMKNPREVRVDKFVLSSNFNTDFPTFLELLC